MAESRKVIIDAGHGGAEPGAIYQGRQEKTDNLRLALAVGQILSNNGVEVAYTRVTDIYQTPFEKAQMANNWDADYFLSIHRNAMPVPGTASGIQSLVYADESTAALMAENINQELVKMGWRDLGVIERPGLVVLRRTEMPAVLVEAGYLDNEADNQFFDANFGAVADAIAQGVLNTLREEEKEPEYYQIQVGAYENRALADQLLNRLLAEGLPAFLIEQDGLYKVRVGAYLNLDNAAWMEKTLRSMGYPTVMVRESAVR
ncbi:MAG: N-acetylmuramoyl-L-alanine amidase [Lachnospiraceae bacterium]|nr:N-acetylmuramoyl-L-alanine amidase [Lachnospiraceae bacterium]